MSDSLFKPVLDTSEGTLTANQVQGVFGEFKPVIDDAQTAAPSAKAVSEWRLLQDVGY